MFAGSSFRYCQKSRVGHGEFYVISEECLKNDGIREDELVELVERCPMHVGEIDFMARQASVLAVIRGGSGRPGLDEVREVIGRSRRAARSPVLFGGD